MTGEQNGEGPNKLLDSMVRDADEYYALIYLQQLNQTRVYAAV